MGFKLGVYIESSQTRSPRLLGLGMPPQRRWASGRNLGPATGREERKRTWKLPQHQRFRVRVLSREEGKRIVAKSLGVIWNEDCSRYLFRALRSSSRLLEVLFSIIP